MAGVELSGSQIRHVTALSPSSSSSPQLSDGQAFAGSPAAQGELGTLSDCCGVICKLITVTAYETASFAGRPSVPGGLADFMDTVNQDLDHVDNDLLYQRAAGNLLCIVSLSWKQAIYHLGSLVMLCTWLTDATLMQVPVRHRPGVWEVQHLLSCLHLTVMSIDCTKHAT